MTSSPPNTPAGQAPPAVQLQAVSRLYGSFVALRNVSLTLENGTSTMLLGPNGAGKSTLLKLIAGLARPFYGEVLTFGQPPTACCGRIAYMGHSTMLYDELTGPENLEYLLGLQRPTLSATERRQQVAQALADVDLDPTNPRRLGEYSQGMRQRASLARVLLTDPDLLLLDEPFSNLDTASITAMLARLKRFVSDQPATQITRTLLLTTHQAELARPLAQQTLLLREGALIPQTAQTQPVTS